jgi:hemerythrin-like domain-containing protein
MLGVMGETSRRRFVVGASGGALGILVAGCSPMARARLFGAEGAKVVGPAEDLMREHGVLDRVLLVYEEGVRQLRGGGKVPVDTLAKAAGVVRRFVEDYHEKLEEDYVFPRFEHGTGEMAALVATLRRQHEAGRRVTDDVLKLAKPAPMRAKNGRTQLADALQTYIRMYRPHAAREDTVLFPALYAVLGDAEKIELGEAFEARERELFGERGFVGVVEEVAALEKGVGILELAQFTPRRPAARK